MNILRNRLSIISRYNGLMSKKRILILSGVVVLILIVAGLYFFLFSDKNENNQQEPPKKYYSQLTGVEVPQETAERPILGIMIENSEFARPQTGLDSAGIVFEAVTEGGITRYLVLYQEDMPEIVGPVRSVRSHFVDWLMGFDASIAHVGGSEEALNLIDQRQAKSLNQFRFSGPYFRDENREPPHNMYARTANLRKLQKDEKHATAEFPDIPRSGDNPSQTPTATKITIDFSGPAFKAEFRYDKAANLYVRYLAGEPHIDTITNKPITVKNVIVVKAQGLPNGVNAIGTGEALLFKDGNVQKIKWEKPDYKSRIKFKDSVGKEIQLNRGQTWVAAVAADRPVTY